jgi:hypothetical protein
MKRWIVLTMAVLVLISAAPRPAQSNLGIFATWWDGNDAGSAFGGGAKYKIALIPIIGMDVRASYVKFDNEGLYAIPLEATGMLDFGMLYGGLAMGYYIWGGNDAASSSNRFGGSILGGISMGMGGIGVFGELRYTIVKTVLDDVVDVKADGFNVVLGLTF